MNLIGRHWLVVLAASLTITMRVQAVSTIQFTATSYSTNESGGTATLSVQRRSDINTEASVHYDTADGTATNGINFTAVSGMLIFGASETNKTIGVPILNDGFAEGIKTFKVLLSDPTGGAVLGVHANAAVCRRRSTNLVQAAGSFRRPSLRFFVTFPRLRCWNR
jgi:hypothetical protein